MSITPMQMYWLVKLDCIIGLFVFVGACMAVALIPICIYTSELPSSEQSVYYGLVRKIIFAILVCASVAALLPTTRQMAAIIVVPKIVNNEKVQTIGNRVYDLAVGWMDELAPKKDDAHLESGKR